LATLQSADTVGNAVACSQRPDLGAARVADASIAWGDHGCQRLIRGNQNQMADETSRDRAAALVTNLLATLSSGDLDALKPFFDDDSTWAVAAVERTGTPPTGPEGIVERFFRPVRESLFEPRDPKVNIENLWVDGAWVFVEARGSGKLKNGNSYANRYMFCIRTEGDKVKEVREYMDTAYAAKIAEGIPRS
jgi:uncharacterized protein